jgi:hypothetical protein
MDLGIVQGRLLKPVDGKIQEFPFVNWEKEFHLLKKVGLTHMEWIINHNYYRSNPFFYCDLVGLPISSICLDNIITDFDNLHSILVRCYSRANMQFIKRVTLPFLEKVNLDNDEIREKVFDELQTCGVRDIYSLETDCTIEHLKEIMILDGLSITYDTGNINAKGIDHVEFINTFHDTIDNVHIKDRSSDNGSSVALNTGDTPFDLIFETLAKNNYKGMFTLQTQRTHTCFEYERALTDIRTVKELYEKHF